MLAAHAATAALAAARLAYLDGSRTMLPLDVTNCPNETVSVFNAKPLPVSINETLAHLAPILQAMNITRPSHPVESESNISLTFQYLYSISYMWYAVIGTVICFTLGTIVGYITGTDDDAYDERLLHPLVAKLARKMPGKPRKYTNEKTEKTTEEKDTSEKTEETVVTEEVKPTVFCTNTSRLFDAYETRSPSPFPERTRL